MSNLDWCDGLRGLCGLLPVSAMACGNTVNAVTERESVMSVGEYELSGHPRA